MLIVGAPLSGLAISKISHATFASGMHTAFLVAAIGLLTRRGNGEATPGHAGL